jgi:hypothetical protein
MATSHDEKNEMPTDDSASDTLKSTSRSIDEKTAEGEAEELQQGSSSAAPADNGLTKTKTATSIAKEAQAELTKIMTSAEGMEYPTGVKLGLIMPQCLFDGSCMREPLLMSFHVMLANLCRTIPLLQLQFLISPINSTLCQMLDGMGLHIY